MTETALNDLWRTGRKVGRTIYARRGPEASDSDPLIGVMDTPELASRAVCDHNAAVRAKLDEAVALVTDAQARQEQDAEMAAEGLAAADLDERTP